MAEEEREIGREVVDLHGIGNSKALFSHSGGQAVLRQAAIEGRLPRPMAATARWSACRANTPWNTCQMGTRWRDPHGHASGLASSRSFLRCHWRHRIPIAPAVHERSDQTLCAIGAYENVNHRGYPAHCLFACLQQRGCHFIMHLPSMLFGFGVIQCWHGRRPFGRR